MMRGRPIRLQTIRVCLFVGAGLLVVTRSLDAQAQPFTFTLVQTDLTTVDYGALAFADLNRDGNYDLVASGNDSRLPPFRPRSYVALSRSEALRPNGQWLRAFDRISLSTEVWHSAVTWIDYDRDGDLDFVVSGTTRSGAAFENLPFEGLTRLYRNDGEGQFEALDAGLIGVYGSTVAAGDYDNDGDDDLLLSGLTDPDTPVTHLYRNDDGAFIQADASFSQVAFGDAQWSDYDNDGDLDLTLSGATAEGAFLTELYRNNGNGGFEAANAGFRGLAFSSLDWGDYDNDGDLDLALSGATLSLPNFFDGVAEIYRNDQGRFTHLDADLEGILYGSSTWGDYDNDGDLDLLIIGGDNVTSGRTGRVYRNEGGAFAPRLALVGLTAASVAWGDYDNDGDLDILTTGTNVSFNPLTRLYRNDQLALNTPPTPPTGLQANVVGASATLSWTRAEDGQTPAPGLTYTLRVGTAPGAANVVPAQAEPSSGQRWLPRRGGVDHNTSWTLTNLSAGTYYWSVQAIDHSFIGSAFAEEGSFTISATADVGTGTDDEADLPTRYALHQSFPNPFLDATTIAYDLPEATPVTLTIYSVLGAEVIRLVDHLQPAGRRQVVWDARNDQGHRVGAGVYFVRMQAGQATWTRSLVVLN